MTNLTKDNLIAILKDEGITDKNVLNAMHHVPREKFISINAQSQAYENQALSIECQQTISQPYIVAHMTQCLLENKTLSSLKILEIGTGSGYQAAILSELVNEVYTIERIEQLYKTAQQTLKKLHYQNIYFRYGDGHLGWSDAAPFDGIMVTAGTDCVPPALLEQLSPYQGRLVIPVGSSRDLDLISITRNKDDYHTDIIEKVSFVPLKPGVE